MSGTDWQVFEGALHGLALATNYQIAPSEWSAKAGEYFRACEDLDLPIVLDGIDTLKREQRFFPAISVLREAAYAAQAHAIRARVSDGHREPYDDCTMCGDTGWQPHECPAEPCGRRHNHGPHSFVSACPCRPTNHTYQRAREREHALIVQRAPQTRREYQA